jgi:hypothetical protein
MAIRLFDLDKMEFLSYLIRLRPENIIIELKNGAGTCDNKYPL